MKTETKVNDLQIIIAREAANREAAQKLSDIKNRLDHAAINAGNIPSGVADLITAQNARSEAVAAVAKLPKARREMAESAHKIAREIGMVAAKLGESYSGETTFSVRWGTTPSATTSTRFGERYSRSCRYSKTDAHHLVVLAPAGIPGLIDGPALVAASARDGLPLISLDTFTGDAVWVRRKNKAIIYEAGYIAYDSATDTTYHSTESLDAAQKGLSKKVTARRAELEAAKASRKEARRIQLIARLCSGATATIADARALGYCSPGIAAFQAAQNIGDTATLPQLIRSGNPSAVRLALHLALKLSQARNTTAAAA